MLAKFAAKIFSINKPFVIGFDGNMATVVAPQTPTCGNKTYDFFVMSEGLVGSIIHVKALEAAPCFPHSPVEIWFGDVKPEATKMQHVRPRQFPRERPIGCQRPAPAAPSWSWQAGIAPGNFGQVWAQLVGHIERKLRTFYDLGGEAAKTSLGRSKGMIVKHAPLEVDFKLGLSMEKAGKANRWASIRALLGKLAGGKFAEHMEVYREGDAFRWCM